MARRWMTTDPERARLLDALAAATEAQDEEAQGSLEAALVAGVPREAAAEAARAQLDGGDGSMDLEQEVEMSAALALFERGLAAIEKAERPTRHELTYREDDDQYVCACGEAFQANGDIDAAFEHGLEAGREAPDA